MTDETWLETRYPGYWVSSLGHVRGPKGRVLRPQIKRGHYTVTVYMADRMRTIFVHVLVCETFHGLKPEGLECRHLDGDAFNNKPENLRWGTHHENEADKRLHNKPKKPRKLTEEQLIDILSRPDESSRVLAEEFGINRNYLNQLRKGTRRKL